MQCEPVKKMHWVLSVSLRILSSIVVLWVKKLSLLESEASIFIFILNHPFMRYFSVILQLKLIPN